MLEMQNITAAYGSAQVLFDISLAVAPGEIVCLLGRNGAGKTTTLKTIMGLVAAKSGSIFLDKQLINTLPAHQIPRHGIAYVPQGRQLFSELSVAQNLEIGILVNKSSQAVRDNTLELFPRLRERLNQRADTLSGGEQQMLAMARALCMEPSVLLLDEPTEGLQPSMIDLIRTVIVKLQQRNVAILLVEQHRDAVLSIATKVVFIEQGYTRESVQASTLDRHSPLLHQYLGV